MLCNVVLPNCSVLEVEVDAKCDGQVCLDKVCEMLGMMTIEADYFGLQYAGEKGEPLWLNMRNRMSLQLAGPQPYRLRLRVKFFVQPHFIQQEQARHIFYQQLKSEFLEDNLKVSDRTLVAQIGGLIAQAEYGDYSQSHTPMEIYRLLLPAAHRNSTTVKEMADVHACYAGTSRVSMEYKTLKLISSLEAYGVEYHDVWDGSGQLFHIGVGPEGISVYRSDWVLDRSIAYPMIQTATNERRSVCLDIVNDDANISKIVFKLVSPKAANGLYRSVTEMHSFYRCDTVRNTVVSQFSRDFKGTLASLFNENTTLGKKYVFDVRRTCREVYDHARRVLFASGQSEMLRPHELPVPTESMDQEDSACSPAEFQVLKDRLQHICDSLQCCVCMDAKLNTTFVPCGHVACCQACAGRLETCPLCRSHIEQAQTIFLPDLFRQSPIFHDQHSHHRNGAAKHSENTEGAENHTSSSVDMATDESDLVGAMAAMK